MSQRVIPAQWPAPAVVHAVTTTRLGGHSRGTYASLNLGDHVGDEPRTVHANRAELRALLNLPSEPRWLKQVHGTRVVDAAVVGGDTEADGSFTTERGVVCVVLSADCLPVFLCDRQGEVVALLHAGWRGLAAGIIDAGVRRMGVAASSLLAWLGPAIGPQAFEVGDDVRDAFVSDDAQTAPAFVRNAHGRWLADLYGLGRRRLERAGVGAVYGGGYCTVAQPDLFYSYRRDRATGRLASLLWIA